MWPWRLALTAIACGGCSDSARWELTWPADLLDYPARVLLVGDRASTIAVLQPTLDEPLILALESVPSAEEEAWLLLYSRPPAALGIEDGLEFHRRSAFVCELATPDRLYRASPGAEGFELKAAAELPEELVTAELTPEGEACIHADCRLSARWFASVDPAAMVRFFEYPDGRALLVDRQAGLALVDLDRGQVEPLPEQPALPLLDARVLGGELFVLSADGRVSRGPLGGAFEVFARVGDAGPVAAGGLAAGGVGPEIYAAIVRVDGDSRSLEVFEVEKDGATVLGRSPIDSGLGFSDKVSLEWVAPQTAAGVYGGERIFVVEDGRLALDGPRPEKELIPGVPLQFLSLLRR